LLGWGLEDDLLAGQVLELADEVAFAASLVDVGPVEVGPEILVAGLRVGEQMPDDGQDRVADGDDRAFLAAPGSRLSRRGLAPTAAGAASPGCGAKRWRCWPGSASSTTPSWNAARCAASPEDVLEAIARALQLDDVERAHLFDLVRAAKQRPTRSRRTPERVRPSVQRVLDTITEAAAFVRNGRLEILSANRLGYALYSEVFANPDRPANLARFVFLDRRSREFYGDWDGIADAAVGNLRAEAGRDPYDRDLTDLVGELSMRSEQFRVRWPSHDVRQYRTGTQPFHHPLVGDLTLSYEALEVTADIGQTLIVYTAQPDSPSQQALNRLANWSAMPNQPSRQR
jgi:hypothetical protein